MLIVVYSLMIYLNLLFLDHNKNDEKESASVLHIPLNNLHKNIENKTFIKNNSHRTFAVHKDSKQVHRKHRKRRQKRKAQRDVGKSAVFPSNLFIYNNSTKLLNNRQLMELPYSTFASLNPLSKQVSYSRPLNAYGFSSNQQIPPNDLTAINPILNQVSYSIPNLVSNEISSNQPVLVNPGGLYENSYILPRTISNEEKNPQVPSSNYNIAPTTINLVLPDNLLKSSNYSIDSNQIKRTNIGSAIFPKLIVNHYFPSLNTSSQSNTIYSSESDKLLKHPMLSSIKPRTFQSKSFEKRKSIIADVKPLRDFPTDTDLVVEEKDIIPGPDDLQKLDEQMAIAKDNIDKDIDVPFSSKNQLQDLSVVPKGLFNASKYIQAQTPNTTLTHAYTPQQTYQVLLQQRKITGHSLYHHIPHKSYADEAEESVVSDISTNKKGLNPNLIIGSANISSNIPEYKLSDLYNRDTVPRPSPENVKKAIIEIKELKSEVQKLLDSNSQKNFQIDNLSDSSTLYTGNLHNMTYEADMIKSNNAVKSVFNSPKFDIVRNSSSKSLLSVNDDIDEFTLLDDNAHDLGFQTAPSNGHYGDYNIFNSGKDAKHLE